MITRKLYKIRYSKDDELTAVAIICRLLLVLTAYAHVTGEPMLSN